MVNKKIAAREFIVLISDREWHELFELHDQYRISPSLILELLDLFSREELIVREGYKIRLAEKLSARQFSLLNWLQKTERPKALDVFFPRKISNAKRYRLTADYEAVKSKR